MKTLAAGEVLDLRSDTNITLHYYWWLRLKRLLRKKQLVLCGTVVSAFRTGSGSLYLSA